MKAGGGKQKGAEFERLVCKKLSLWVSGGLREDLFWRSAMSGGRATVGRKQGKDHAKHAGDISATHPAGHALTDRFYVECKFVAKLNFDAWLRSDKGEMAAFWKVAQEQAAAHKLTPMMIVKQNASDIFLITPAPHILSGGAAGMFHFSPHAARARLHKAKADIYLFDEVIAKPFAPPSAAMLKPGELHVILSGDRPPSAKTLKAIEQVVQAAAPRLLASPAARTYFTRSMEALREAGLKKRLKEVNEYAEVDAPKPARVKPKSAVTVRRKV